MRAVVIGASGGIGRALTEALAARGDVELVHALSRSNDGPEGDKIRPGRVDLLDEASIEAAARAVSDVGGADLVIVAAGLLSDGEALQPEKTYKAQTAAAFERVFAVNTIGPALAAKHFLPILPREGRAVFAALSARVGSISDNRIGGWHAYRASKAALNMLLRNYAIEQGRRNAGFICVGLHPGTVDTALSEPFQANVPDKQLVQPGEAAANLLRVIDDLTPADSGGVFDYAGEPVPA